LANLDIAWQRLRNQRITGPAGESPSEVVAYMGAVQAQDYAGAKWAVGQRVRGASDATIEQALSEGTILRTHVLRPTWHFVAREDIRWLLALTAPRVHVRNGPMYRRLGLDDTVFERSHVALAEALQGGQQLTRQELAVVLEQAGIAADGLRLVYLLMRAELDGVVCSGARRGKQFTYALLDERAPQARLLKRDEALAELTRRYFASHGPATLQDFVWWSGLLSADARAGLDMATGWLEQESIGERTYWLPRDRPVLEDPSAQAYLLSNYDEYVVGYTDRDSVLDVPAGADQNAVFRPTIIIDGRLVGTWKRTFKKDTLVMTISPWTALSEAQRCAVQAAAERYGRFLGMPQVVMD
jgi:hypothetical protein